LPSTVTISAKPTTGYAPLSVQFNCIVNTVDGNISTFYWDFGDGTSVTAQLVTHIFQERDKIYTVKVTVTDDKGVTGTGTVLINISGNIPPKATSHASITTGKAPLTVLFTGAGNDSDGNIASYHWNFGDGQTSSIQNPTHTFINPGKTYTVSLTVTDNDDATATDTISITTLAERTYFTLTGKIHNGYDTKVDVDYIITSSGDWHDLGRTIYGINQNGENSFSSNVKTGFGEYTLLIGWFYPYTDTQFDRCDYKFSNPSAKDMSFDIVILPSGKIRISE
jgi:PKD repeat protein